jgi:hypothetical protein
VGTVGLKKRVSLTRVSGFGSLFTKSAGEERAFAIKAPAPAFAGTIIVMAETMSLPGKPGRIQERRDQCDTD